VLWDKKVSLLEEEAIADVSAVVECEFGFGQRGRHCRKALKADGVVSTVLVVTVWIKQQGCGHRAASFWIETQA
jgi:hypothetical protein